MNTEYNDNREYKNALDGLRFSEEAKARMAKRLMDTMERPEQAPETRRRVRRMPRIAVIGVAAALALGVGASATGVLKTAGEAFAGVFGPTADTEIIDKIGRPVGASDTDNGVTVTADAIIGDKYHYAVTYSIEKKDGAAFDIDLTDTVGEGLLPMGFADGDTSLMGYFGGAHGGSYFYDADPADNAIQYVETREITRCGRSSAICACMRRTIRASLSAASLPRATGRSSSTWILRIPRSACPRGRHSS